MSRPTNNLAQALQRIAQLESQIQGMQRRLTANDDKKALRVAVIAAVIAGNEANVGANKWTLDHLGKRARAVADLAEGLL